MLALLPQKPNKSSKSKEYLEELTTRLTLWTEGKMDELINEGLQTIKNHLKAPHKATNIAKISKIFKVLIRKGNVNGALKLLTLKLWN